MSINPLSLTYPKMDFYNPPKEIKDAELLLDWVPAPAKGYGQSDFLKLLEKTSEQFARQFQIGKNTIEEIANRKPITVTSEDLQRIGLERARDSLPHIAQQYYTTINRLEDVRFPNEKLISYAKELCKNTYARNLCMEEAEQYVYELLELQEKSSRNI